MISKERSAYIRTLVALVDKLKNDEKLTDVERTAVAMYVEDYLSFVTRYKECEIRIEDEKKFKHCHYYHEYIIDGVHAPLCYNDSISEEQSRCPCENCDWYITNEEVDRIVRDYMIDKIWGGQGNL